ncbi:amino acid adenylation domain-containing protein [Hahella sp. KA22]|uniref:non-ribosomal peptide synthetase n=1 Tax=Hahella sp. KA22 TaxID=1628392 RepID=UPI000FDE56D1|nr:non-ribosomal peptide synthetase [Hahella sp. KA22]AZZ92862.1 amino acid adenylation domain-containing protein [Hahella sp. KA22]QAY56236.1 amino acid adenylation domain-containing protein [Hahella sp. KA22]
MIKKENLKDLYPLSPMQEGMLYQSLLHPDAPVYHEQALYRLRGELRVDLLEQAWERLFQRHDILRVQFIAEKVSRPLQAVLHQRVGEFHYNDLRKASPDFQEELVRQAQAEDRQRSFDLQREPLMRMRLLQLADDRFVLLWSLHHILMDGWCLSLLLRDFTLIYDALREARPLDLPAPPPYSRYIQWLERQDATQARNYWREQLEDYHQAAQIPRQQTLAPAGAGKRTFTHALPRPLSERVRQAAADWGMTPGAILQAAWGALLARYNDCDDLVFGTLVSGRPAELPGTMEMVGVFINTLPLRLRISPDATLRELAQATQLRLLEAESRQYLPLSEVQQLSPLGKDLLTHLFAFENYPAPAQPDGAFRDAIQVESISKHEDIPYDFGVTATPEHSPQGTTLVMRYLYNPAQFEGAFVERLSGHYERLLRQGLGASGDVASTPLQQIDLLGAAEYDRLRAFHGETHPLPSCDSYLDLFEQAVAAAPDSIAVEDGERRISYRELDERANALAALLQERYDVGVEDRIGVALPRSAALLIAELAAGKAGAAFVPVDPDYPPERRLRTFQQAQCKLVIGDAEEAALWGEYKLWREHSQIPFIPLDALDPNSRRPQAPARACGLRSLAYVIFTSGSTGEPKGVMLEHLGLINLIQWSRRQFGILAGKRTTLLASPAFDASVWESLPSLCAGATIVITPDAIRRDVGPLCQFLHDRLIDISFLPPALCEEACVNYPHLLQNIVLQSGGDTLKGIRNGGASDRIKVSNNYGPSEFSVCATSCYLAPQEPSPYPIGKPIANAEALILDRQQRLAPLGAAGEIALAGPSLARGYWGRADLTAARFVAHPCKPGERVYLTGDKGRWREDGNLDFLGRIDDQLSVRGHRVEPAEIEHLLSRHERVRAAAVAATRGADGHTLLAAFVTPRSADDSPLDLDDIRQWLTRRAPSYMTPAILRERDRLPLNANGKLDRKALEREAEQLRAETPYEAPQTATEKQVAEIWSQVLDRRPIGRSDHFLELGGHSLSATRVLSQLRGRLQRDLPLALLFDKPVLKDLAAAMDALATAAAPASESGIRRVDRSRYAVSAPKPENQTPETQDPAAAESS